ncbi:MAG TPA: hypothetical protein VN828_15735 [Acidobacteriaceae bacterium]|nr:hypothetical protein [Acidobacteriaceae bacterium]
MKPIGTLSSPDETARRAHRRMTKKGGDWSFYLSARNDSVFITIGEPPKLNVVIGVYDKTAMVPEIAEDISFMDVDSTINSGLT